MNQNHIAVHKDGGMSFVGPDATKLFQAITLRSSLSLYAKCGMIPTRGVTITRMLALTKTFTGKTYKRGREGAAAAAADMQVWIDAAKASMPVEVS
jgi:hypothetical protein